MPTESEVIEASLLISFFNTFYKYQVYSCIFENISNLAPMHKLSKTLQLNKSTSTTA